ncbi:MAG: hypothetical protein R2694_19115 [Ilumatobacteraceae bacterium]
MVAQSDEQARGRTIRELERHRDDSLVAVMQGLRSTHIGAGLVLDRYERQLFSRAGEHHVEHDPTRPLRLYETTVPVEWVDYNGHMNDSRFFQVTSEAGDRLMRFIGVDEEYLTHSSYYTVESHMNFGAQAKAGDLAVRHRATAVPRRQAAAPLHHHPPRDDEVVPGEHMMLHVDTVAGKFSPPRSRCWRSWRNWRCTMPPRHGRSTPGGSSVSRAQPRPRVVVTPSRSTSCGSSVGVRGRSATTST